MLKQNSGIEFFYDAGGVAGLKYNGVTYFYRKDAQGNIIAILNASGEVVVKYEYDAWGNHAVLDINGNDITSGIGELNPFRYRGYYYDKETELYYLQSRYYDPEVGRFISQDCLEYADHETINGLNLYAYCGNNPVMNVDPTGEGFFIFLFAAIVGFVVSFSTSAITQAVFNDGKVNWGVAAIDGLFGAISSVLFMVPAIGPIASGFINFGLSMANSYITVGMENDWQYDMVDHFSILATSILNGFVSGKVRKDFFENGGKKILTQAHKFVSTVTKRLFSGYYNNSSALISKSARSAILQLNKTLFALNFGKGFYKDWTITVLQMSFSSSLIKALKGIFN